MTIDFVPFLSFALITTFTPGPNTISSAAMGISHGLGGSRNYRLGIASGFFLIMLSCALLSKGILGRFPEIQRYLSYAGALYILWLAFHIVKAEYGFNEEDQKLLGYKNGMLLQLLNPKVIVYGLTIYSVYLSTLRESLLLLPLSALGLALISFCAVSSWAVFGSGIRRVMNNGGVRKGVNILLALLLVYSAWQISGIGELF